MYLKMYFAKCRPICRSTNELNGRRALTNSSATPHAKLIEAGTADDIQSPFPVTTSDQAVYNKARTWF